MTALEFWAESLGELHAREKRSAFQFLQQRARRLADQRAADTPFGREPTDRQPNMGTWHPVQDVPTQASGVGQPFALKPASLKLDRTPLATDQTFRDQFTKDTDMDLQLGHTLIGNWKSDPSHKNLEYLYEHFSPGLLEPSIRTFSKRRLPEPAVRARVYNTFHEALDQFDPSIAEETGKTFHEFFRDQHVRGRKAIAGEEGTGMSRWADRYSRFGSVNWQRGTKLNKYRLMSEHFELEHGQSATAAELAERAGVKIKDMERIIKELRPDHLHSRNEKTDFLVDEAQVHEITWSKIRDSVAPQERAMLDAWSGNLDLPSSQQKKDSELAAQFGLTPQKWSRVKRGWRDRFSLEVQQQQRFM